ncbi:UDP-N-acetylglucosamine diphosphorylase [Patescibacteria group bacterium]|nr:UDP-N-acetylglucosamine diphosphorylase [Patescibacteria group bacterium]
MYFPIKDFCDTSSFSHSNIFKKKDNAWEVIPEIKNYLEEQFKKGAIKANYKKSNNVFIGKGTTIMDGVVIKGPAIIGENCFISSSVLIRENCLIGNDVTIGHACEIKNSILLNNSTAAHFNYIGDSIIGNNVNLAGGAIVANLRLDKKPVTINLGHKKISTNLLKFGAIIGDNCNIGANAVLNPGTILGKDSVVFPLISVSGLHPGKQTIK